MLVVFPAAAFLARQPVKIATTKRYSSRSSMDSRYYSNQRYNSDQRYYDQRYYDQRYTDQRYNYDSPYYNQGRPPIFDSRARSTMQGVGRMPYQNYNYNNYNNYQNDVYSQTWNQYDTTVQGGSLKTWSFYDPRVERVQVSLATEGRPLKSKIELWEGPDNTPYKLDVYVEDGYLRPFNAFIDVPGGSNSISVRNTGELEFPIAASVTTDNSSPYRETGRFRGGLGGGRIIQGGAVHTIPFDPNVQAVEVFLRTDGRPLTARVELMQGPYNDKQVMEIYCQDGMFRPFRAVIQTPGVGNVVRIVNTASVEFPLTASVEPYGYMSR